MSRTRTRKPHTLDQISHRKPGPLSAPLTQPVVAKHGSLFLLATEDGDVRAGSDQGVYFHDMRYISAETLRLDGHALVPLLTDASEGHRAVFELTNPELRDAGDQIRVRKQVLGVRREKCLLDEYVELIRLESYAGEPAEFTLQLAFDADFADMFVVRGMHPGKRGKLRAPAWRGNTLTFRYEGADGHLRTATLNFSRSPDARRQGEIQYRLRLKHQQHWQLKITCKLRDLRTGRLESRPDQTSAAREKDRDDARRGSLAGGTQVETSNPLFNEIITRSFLDLQMLSMCQGGDVFFAAGVPWYVALFGRDSLVTSIQMAAFEPEVAANTLRVLASHQGTRVDDWRDEQPGKILHELRVDELAELNEIPQTPYFGSVDSTPLFLVLLGLHSAWTGTLELFEELRDNVCRALAWIDQFGDSDHDGFIDYQTHSPRGGRNQGWKDSGNGIVMDNGVLAEPPIALPEVQGDVYFAWCLMAGLFEHSGDRVTAQMLRKKAQRLYRAFNRAFWLPEQRYYAFCRQAGGQFSRSIASNAAHALWTGIIDPRRARAIVKRVLQPDMFSGWGIRTLSLQDRSYNPLDYQLGSVWPHDNAMIVAGMHRYHFKNEANQVFSAMMQAATRFEHFRLPELFAGYDRSFATRPVKYPVACNPQAWAAGSIPYMLASTLGLRPDAFNRRLRIEHAHLPEWLDCVTVRRLRVGEAEVALRYERSHGETAVAVTNKHGDVEVIVQS